MPILAPHPPHCHACGYDTSSIAADASRCPECGVELSAWRSRWQTRLTLHGLTLLIFGSAACAGVWILNHAVRAWFSAAGTTSTDLLAAIRPTESLIFLPAILTLAGIGVLALNSTDSSFRRRFALVVAGLTACVFCVMLSQRTLAGTGSYDGPVWMQLVSIRNAGWWACAGLVPLCVGAALSLLSDTARAAGLVTLAGWCALATVWLPVAAILAIATCELYEYVARVSLAAAQSSAVQFSGRGFPNAPPRVVPTPPMMLPAPWYWTTGVQFSRVLLYAFLISSSTAIWLAAYFTRLRLRDATDPNR